MSDVSKQPSFRALQAGVSSVFNNMNRGFIDLVSIESGVREFLFRFDAIYSLNQDVLLEHHYAQYLALGSPDRWTGLQLPGMKRVPDPNTVGRPSLGKDTWVPDGDSSYTVAERLQPLYKLHGSSNWRTIEGGELLVVGGNKIRSIGAEPVLKWYAERFEEDIQAGSRLFVIGYSFRDSHVNEVIVNGVRTSALKFFVVDPLGSEVVRHANSSYGGMAYSPGELDSAFAEGLVGASRRGLKETFGSDPISYANVMSFFN